MKINSLRDSVSGFNRQLDNSKNAMDHLYFYLNEDIKSSYNQMRRYIDMEKLVGKPNRVSPTLLEFSLWHFRFKAEVIFLSSFKSVLRVSGKSKNENGNSVFQKLLELEIVDWGRIQLLVPESLAKKFIAEGLDQKNFDNVDDVNSVFERLIILLLESYTFFEVELEASPL